jgi:anti-sigma B factor antagonist
MGFYGIASTCVDAVQQVESTAIASHVCVASKPRSARKGTRTMMVEHQDAAPGHRPQPDKDDFNAIQTWVDQVAVVSVSGSVDMLSAPRLADAIDATVAQSPSGLIVDLSKVGFLGSAGISVLVKTHDSNADAISFCVVADGPNTYRPLTLLGINENMSICRTLDDALSTIADT